MLFNKCELQGLMC